MSLRRRYNRRGDVAVEAYGAGQMRQPWRPPTSVRQARDRQIQDDRRPKTWQQYFREYRAYADCVLEMFRKQG